MKLSELTHRDLAELRVLAAIELAYPLQTAALGDRAASVILARHQAKYGTAERYVEPRETIMKPSISGVKA